MQPGQARSGNVVDSLSYILASRQRERVLAAVIPGPQTPVQISKQTGLRLSHVSRTLGELVRADLLQCVSAERRGKLYGISNLGVAVFGELVDNRGDRLIAPMVRGSHCQNFHHWVAVHHGRAAADEALIEVGLHPGRLNGNGWYPVRSLLGMLDYIEARFGDGTYDTIRRMMRDEVPNFLTLKRLGARALPFPILLELMPGAYNREFNHGRLEVEVHPRHALMKSYDWMSSPARCALRLGMYEGLLAMVGVRGTVSKVACMLRGDPYCGYEIGWAVENGTSVGK